MTPELRRNAALSVIQQLKLIEIVDRWNTTSNGETLISSCDDLRAVIASDPSQFPNFRAKVGSMWL